MSERLNYISYLYGFNTAIFYRKFRNWQNISYAVEQNAIVESVDRLLKDTKQPPLTPTEIELCRESQKWMIFINKKLLEIKN